MRRRAGEVSTDRLLTLSPILGFLSLVTLFAGGFLAVLFVLAGLFVGIWTLMRLSAEQQGKLRPTARTVRALTGTAPAALIGLLSVYSAFKW